MAKTKLSADQFEEELNRQTTDLNVKRHELDDIRTLTDMYQKTIEEKGKDLIIKDARLKAAKEKNQAELWQLSMELSAAQESLQHELNFHQAEVSSLSNANQRYLDLYNDNLRLKASIDELESLYHKETHSHAIQMHQLNRERKDIRKNMEDKLRKDLAGLEIAFQQQAFDALLDSQKMAMFENAKLKDEVAMQGVGITNITGRLVKQRKASDKCRQYLRKYRQKAERLREQLAIVTGRKNDIAKRKKALDDEEALLMEQSQTIYNKYCVRSSDDQISHAEATVLAYIQAMREFRGQEAMLATWKQRHQLLQTLHIDLKPTTKDEQHGLYTEKLFPMYPVMCSFQDINAHNPYIPFKEYIECPSSTNEPNNNTSATVAASEEENNLEGTQELNPAMLSLGAASVDSTDGQSVPSLAVSSHFTLQSGSIHTENTSVGANKRQLNRLKQAGDAILSAIQGEDGLQEAVSVIHGKEKRIVSLIQLSCEKEKAKMRRAKRQELKEQKKQAQGAAQSPALPSTNSRPGTAESGFGENGKSLQPFEGQNMVAWAVMKMVHIWAQTRPCAIPDADLASLNAENLQLLPKPVSTSSAASFGANAGVGMGSLSSSLLLTDETAGERSSAQDRRPAMLMNTSTQPALFTPQQIADHHFHQDVLRQLEVDKKQGLILQEDRPLVGGGGSGMRHLEHDDFSIGSASSSSSLSHIDEENDEEEDMLMEEDQEQDPSMVGEPKKPSEMLRGHVPKVSDPTDSPASTPSVADATELSAALGVGAKTALSTNANNNAKSLPHSASNHSISAAAEMLYASGVHNDGLRTALRREAEIAHLEKERMEEDLLQHHPMSTEELDAHLTLGEELDALHQRSVADWDSDEADVLTPSGTNGQQSQWRVKMTNRKNKRSWIERPPAFVPNPFAQQQQQALFSTQQPVGKFIGGIRVQNKECFEIGPPLLLRRGEEGHRYHDSSAAGSANHPKKLRESLSAGRLMQVPVSASQPASPFLVPSSTSTYGFGDAPDGADCANERVLSNVELRALDPLKHKPRRQTQGISTVQISSKVLKNVPRSVSAPLLALQQHQHHQPLLHSHRTFLSPLPTAAMGIAAAGNTGDTVNISLPMKKQQLRMNASTGALPRYR